MADTESAPDNGIRLIAGLGNPGKEYEKTRHNVGFDALDLLADSLSLEWVRDRKSKALVARRGRELILVKPQTYMNRSGQAVAQLARFYQIPVEGILVVFDDVDTPLGRIRFKQKGSAGGHNGIKSIIQCLGTDQFARLKIGIGASGRRDGMVDHVLGKFDGEERPEIERALDTAVASLEHAIAHDLPSAMNLFNRKDRPEKNPPPPPADTTES